MRKAGFDYLVTMESTKNVFQTLVFEHSYDDIITKIISKFGKYEKQNKAEIQKTCNNVEKTTKKYKVNEKERKGQKNDSKRKIKQKVCLFNFFNVAFTNCSYFF